MKTNGRKTTRARVSYEVRYVGAPYGENESGEVVSRHRSPEAARAARARLQDNPRYYGSNTRVARVEGGVVTFGD